LLERGKPEKRDHYFTVLHKETDRLANLIQGVLDISNLDDWPRLETNPFTEVAAFMVDFTRVVASKGQSRNRMVVVQPSAVTLNRLPAIRIPGRHLEKALINIIDNALLYSDEAGEISLDFGLGQAPSQAMVWFRVKDEGPGIPEDERPRLFDRFFRGRQALEKGRPGTGLGLALARESIERYGGYIEVESGRNYTCFTVWVPLAPVSGANDQA
jgi:signal transduction histidine kinase